MTGESGDGYPGARWIPAHPDRFRAMNSRRIEEIVLHITEGGTADAEVTARNAFGIKRYWQNNHWMQQASHYIVGRAGEVVQCVRDRDMAFHAGPANEWSIGIEHNVRGKDSKMTAAQYLSSARLVVWLCEKYALPVARASISGHNEADPSTTHKRCPDRVLKWELYMEAIAHVQSVQRGHVPMRLWHDEDM